MKLIILLILFVLFLLSLVKINYKENFSSGSENDKVIKIPSESIPFKKNKCLKIFKSDTTVNNYLKKINIELKKTKTLVEFIPILFVVIRDLTLEFQEKFDKLSELNKTIINYYNILLEEGKLTEFQEINDYKDISDVINFLDFNVNIDGNIFYYGNYWEEVGISMISNKLKLTGEGYAKLKNDIKTAYKLEKDVDDNVLIAVSYNNLVDMYTKAVKFEKTIKEKINFIKDNTQIKEEFQSSPNVKRVKILKNNNKIMLKEKYNALTVIFIWDSLCSIADKLDFNVENLDNEIKNLVI